MQQVTHKKIPRKKKKRFCVVECKNTKNNRRKKVKKLEDSSVEVRRLNTEIQRRTKQENEKY